VNEKRRALGRGLGALIPTAPTGERPVDVFFGAPRPGPEAVAPDVDPLARAEEAQPGMDAGDAGHGAASVARDETGDPAAEDAASALAPVPGAEFAELTVGRIRPNPRQPRQVFDEEQLAELVHSVREIGILQPVVVRRIADPQDPDHDYELIMGERRWRAAQRAELAVVPAIIRSTSDDDLLRDALLENLHRSQLNPLEEAAAYRQLLDDFGCTQEELASRIGRSRPQVSNTLRLLKLPPVVQLRVAAGVLSAGHARALLGLEDQAAMERLAQRIVAEGLSVRSVEEIVAVGGDGSGAPAARRKPRPGARRPQLDELAGRLSDRLDTRVLISLGQRKGKVVVEFASVEDLHRILDVMGLDSTSHE